MITNLPRGKIISGLYEGAYDREPHPAIAMRYGSDFYGDSHDVDVLIIYNIDSNLIGVKPVNELFDFPDDYDIVLLDAEDVFTGFIDYVSIYAIAFECALAEYPQLNKIKNILHGKEISSSGEKYTTAIGVRWNAEQWANTEYVTVRDVRKIAFAMGQYRAYQKHKIFLDSKKKIMEYLDDDIVYWNGNLKEGIRRVYKLFESELKLFCQDNMWELSSIENESNYLEYVDIGDYENDDELDDETKDMIYRNCIAGVARVNNIYYAATHGRSGKEEIMSLTPCLAKELIKGKEVKKCYRSKYHDIAELVWTFDEGSSLI